MHGSNEATAIFVRDHIPLEQGLRRIVGPGKIFDLVRDHIPLEQGLRHP